MKKTDFEKKTFFYNPTGGSASDWIRTTPALSPGCTNHSNHCTIGVV